MDGVGGSEGQEESGKNTARPNNQRRGRLATFHVHKRDTCRRRTSCTRNWLSARLHDDVLLILY